VVIGGVLLLVLLAHIYTAVFSYRSARLFARYFRLRRDRLARVSIGDEPAEAPRDAKESSLTYL
jgi:hypothetical protein